MPTAEEKIIADPKLRDVFDKYALFGNRASLMTPNSTPKKPTEVQLDGMRFAKLIREANLLDATLITSVEVDIIFAKVKPKNERKIKFDDFLRAIKFIGQKKFGPDGFALAQNAIIRIGSPCLSPGRKIPQQTSTKISDSQLVETHTDVLEPDILVNEENETI